MMQNEEKKTRDELNSINWVHAINYGKWNCSKAKQEKENKRKQKKQK